MMNFKDTLIELLKSDERFLIDWELSLNHVKDSIDTLDEGLLDLLYNNEQTREKFFEKNKNSDYIKFKSKDFKFYLDENKLDNSYTQFENQIGLFFDNKLLKNRWEVVLNFPFKDCILEWGQSNDEWEDVYFEYSEKTSDFEEKIGKRKEVFFNEVLWKDEIDRLKEDKVLVNWKRFTKNWEEKVWEIKRDENLLIRENLIIKWNNLLALHSLKKEFSWKIKLIYIDPPYNTWSDSFKYNDNFNHSTWLTFIKNRLEVARDLLSNDWSIWINMDDTESHYLKVLWDSIFWRENFVSNIVWHKKNVVQNDAKYFNQNHDHILVFAKNKEIWRPNLLERTDEMNERYENPDNDPRWVWTSVALQAKSGSSSNNYEIEFSNWVKWKPVEWTFPRLSKNSLIKAYEEWRLWFWKNWTNVPRLKKYLTEVRQGLVPNSIFSNEDCGSTQMAKEELKRLLEKNIFETPKPEKLLKRIIDVSTKEGEYVLDFFGWSWTTGAVAHKLNRKWILIEQMDYITDLPELRLKKVIEWEQWWISKSVNWNGWWEFVYFELKAWNEEAKEKIMNCEKNEDLEVFFDEMYNKYFLNYNLKVKDFKEKILKDKKFKELSFDKQKKMFVRMLDLNQMYVNMSERKDKKFGINEECVKLSEEFYNLR